MIGHAKTLVDTTNMTREEWIKLRSKGIGGSDAGAICGVNPYATPLSVYLEKTGELPPKDENAAMRWGNLLEPVIREQFCKETGYIVDQVPAILQHPDHPWMLANLDGVIIGRNYGGDIGGFDAPGVLEIKTADAHFKDEWERGEIPDHYVLQVQHYLAVTGLDWAIIACLVGGRHLYWHRIERDEELIAYLLKIEADFWAMVEAKTPPEITGGDVELFKILYAEPDPGSFIELPDSVEQLIEASEKAAEQMNFWKAQKEAAEASIQAMMGGCEVGLVGGVPRVTWKTVHRKGYTVEPSSYRKFQVVKRK